MKEKNILIELANLNDIDEIVSLKQKIKFNKNIFY